MDHKLKCSVCKKTFYGAKLKKCCSKECSLIARRKRRNKKDKEIRRKEGYKKYYLKNIYPLSNKYKKEQKEFLLKEEEKKRKKKEYTINWQYNNKIKNAEYRRKTRIKIRGWFDNYKKTLKCEFCGYNKCIEALDFHHKDLEEKEFNIGQALNKWGKEKILEEIKKCIVLCSNCHRELHYNEKQEKIKQRREAFLNITNEPKKLCYRIVEEEMSKEWIKELQDKAKYNLNRFGGNQYTRVDNEISEKIDIKEILAKKIGIGAKTVCRAFQIYRRGTEEQKKRARIGESSITKIWKELEPIRYSNKMVK